MHDYDVLIAGASFAGLACARRAAQLGLRVGVLEKQQRAGQIIRTTGLLVQEAAEMLCTPAVLTRRIEGVRLYAPSMRYMDLDAPGYHFLATDMPALMRWMAAEAIDAGAALHYGQAFRGGRRHGGQLHINGDAYTSRWMVGADGPRSQVAASFGLGRNREFLWGIEAEYSGLPLAEDRLHCFVDSVLAPGYIAWVFMGVGGVTQIGLACRPPSRPDLRALVAKLSRLFDFSGAKLLSRRGGPIPVGGRVPRCFGDGVLLIGDAAGLVSPLTAGGIHSSLESGTAAAEAIADHMLHRAASPRCRLETVYPRYRWKRWLRRLFDRRWPNALLESLLVNPLMRRIAQLIYFHRKGLGSAAGWRALLGLCR